MLQNLFSATLVWVHGRALARQGPSSRHPPSAVWMPLATWLLFSGVIKDTRENKGTYLSHVRPFHVVNDCIVDMKEARAPYPGLEK